MMSAQFSCEFSGNAFRQPVADKNQGLLFMNVNSADMADRMTDILNADITNSGNVIIIIYHQSLKLGGEAANQEINKPILLTDGCV